MDVSRISQGKIELRKQHVELAKVVLGAVETSRPLIDEQGQELTLTMPSDPVIVDADEVRLIQVFMNLLTNAAKYSEKGSRIDLHAERQGSDAVVAVKDAGIGIAPPHLLTIFEMFSQVEGALSRSQGGLGIGLCLVKQLVEMHGGRIEAKSDGPGKGSEFVVRLPIVMERTYSRKISDDGAANPISNLRILVVDDNRDTVSTLTMLFKMMGNDVRTAHDGDEAIRAAGVFHPHVVLLDIGLPKMNGYQVARTIREQPWGKNMILIAMTGWGQEEDKRKSEEAGFDRHMVKPVDPQNLMKLLAGPDVVKVRAAKSS
jgi:CheY-like chemotaxis protein